MTKPILQTKWTTWRNADTPRRLRQELYDKFAATLWSEVYLPHTQFDVIVLDVRRTLNGELEI